jgi:hypothetical protein
MAADLLQIMSRPVFAVADRNHPLPAPEVELHRLVAAGVTFSVAVQFACFHSLSVAGFHVAVQARSAADQCGGDPFVIAVGDLDIPARWEFRTSGLWAEQVCEQPDIHWSYGLEAFALQIDEPDELLRRGYGLRTPLGWELDFEVESIRPGRPSLNGNESTDGEPPGMVEQVGALEGLMLVGPDQFPVAGPAHRIHAWGDRRFVTDAVTDTLAGRSDMAVADSVGPAQPNHVLLPTPIGVWSVDWR